MIRRGTGMILAGLLLVCGWAAAAEESHDNAVTVQKLREIWQAAPAKWVKGFKKTYEVACGKDLAATLWVEVADVEDGKPIVHKRVEIREKEKHAERGTALPFLLAGDEWLEPLKDGIFAIMTDAMTVAVEEDVDVTVAGKNLKCDRFTLKRAGSGEGLTLTFSAEHALGLVGVTAESGGEKAFEAKLTDYGNQ